MKLLKWLLDMRSTIILLGAGYFIYKLVEFIIRKEIRLFKNLKRTIYLSKTGDDTLETERNLLKENGLYSIRETIIDLSNGTKPLQTIKDFSVLVVGYSNNYSRYQAIVDFVRSKRIPLIVLAKPNEIRSEHLDIFQQYIYFEMCNTPARLLTTIFNLSIIIPNEKNRI